MERILLTTTPHLDGVKIEQYIGLVTANQVAGTGFLSDFTASFSDFFGGTSGTYRSQMNDLLDNVQKLFVEKAMCMGANAVIGVSVDFDSISAKNMSMFMVSMKGTGVKIGDLQNTQEMSFVNTVDIVSKENLAIELSKKIIAKNLDNNKRPTDDEWKFLCTHKVSSLAEKLMPMYEKEINKEYPDESFLDNFQQYISCLDYDEAVELIYNNISNRLVYKTIIKCNLFSPEHVLDIFNESGVLDNYALLTADKPSYDKKDLEVMKKIVDVINNRPDVGKIEYCKGIFSGGSDKFICSCGEKNEVTSQYCFACSKDIKGFTRLGNKILDEFIMKVEALDEILNRKE